jgi:CheY-like chemotaxis protein
MLRSRGYDVDTAADGYRVVELATRLHPIAVVLQVGLPGPEAAETQPSEAHPSSGPTHPGLDAPQAQAPAAP